MRFEAGMKTFSRFVIRWRWPILVLVILVTAFLVHATRYLVVNNDYETWMPANDRVTELYLLVDEQFGANALVFAVLDCTEKGVFNPDSLDLVQRLTEALEAIPELFSVSSLTNIVDIRKTEDGIEVRELIPEIPTSREALEELKAYVLSKERYVNTLVSADARYTVLVAYIEGGADEAVAATKVLDTIRRVAGDHPYYFGGDPALMVYMDQYITEDLTFLVPLMLGVMVVILAASFRRFWGVVLPLSFVVICIAWTFGLQALSGMYVNILTPSVVVLLIAMGADYAVHIYNHYLRRGDIEVSTAEITLPVVMSAVTTIAGLLTFATTRVEILQFFGLELAFGLGSACLLSVVLLPVCIRLLRASPEEQTASPDVPEARLVSRILSRAGEWVHGHARFIVTASCLGLLVLGLGLFRLTTNVDYVDLLPEDCPPRQGHKILRDHFGGIYPLSMYLRGDIGDPAVMEMESYVENYLRSYELLSGFISISGLIAEEHWLLNGVYAVPETRQGVANLWLLLEGQEILQTFVDEDRTQSLVTAMIKEPTTGVMKKIAHSVAAFLEERTSDRIVVIDPARLPPEGRAMLRERQLAEAADQLAWIAQGYDKPRRYDPNRFRELLAAARAEVGREPDLEPVWTAARSYLEDEALEVLPPGLVQRIVALLKENARVLGSPGLEDQIARLIADTGLMILEDARITAAGVLHRAVSTRRILRAEWLARNLDPALSPELRDHDDYRKRAVGVLWRLDAEHPVFFASRVEGIPGIEGAVRASRTLELDQTGAPDWFRRMDELLYASQVQSLVLASLIVLVLVSATQMSIRRGLLSLASVLVPLGSILGLMCWVGIPLDFGTVLVGALVVGLGVDGSIHFLHHYHRLVLQGMEVRDAVRATMAHVGRAVLTANATTCLGFLVLTLSRTKALKNFGLVNSMAILLVTVSILTFLPALVSLLHLDNRNRIGEAGPAEGS